MIGPSLSQTLYIEEKRRKKQSEHTAGRLPSKYKSKIPVDMIMFTNELEFKDARTNYLRCKRFLNHPILVIKNPIMVGWIVVDGNHRLFNAIMCGYRLVPVFVLTKDNYCELYTIKNNLFAQNIRKLKEEKIDWLSFNEDAVEAVKNIYFD